MNGLVDTVANDEAFVYLKNKYKGVK